MHTGNRSAHPKVPMVRLKAADAQLLGLCTRVWRMHHSRSVISRLLKTTDSAMGIAVKMSARRKRYLCFPAPISAHRQSSKVTNREALLAGLQDLKIGL